MLHPSVYNFLIILAELCVLGALLLLIYHFSRLKLQMASASRSPRAAARNSARGKEQPDPSSPVLLRFSEVSQRRQYEHQLLTLNRITTELVQIHDINQLYQSLIKTSEELLKGDACGIYLLGPDGVTIEQVVTHNLSGEYSERIKNNYSSLPGGTAFETLQLVKIENVLDDQVYGERVHFFADYGVHALLIMPIFFRELKIGALVVYFNQPHVFEEKELQLGETLASTLAMAIQNARLYQAEHSQREMAEALTRAADALNSTLNLEEVLDNLLEQTLRVVSCKSLNVMLIEGDVAFVVRRKGYEQFSEYYRRFGEIRFPLSTPTIRSMLATGQPLLIANTQASELWTPVEGTQWILSYAAAPLKIGDQVIGFLNVDSDEPYYFNSETTSNLQAFASHAALAIQNAKQYEESRRQTDELASLVRAAAAISTSLDVGQVLQMIASRMVEQFKVDACHLSSYDPINNHVIALATYPVDTTGEHPEWFLPYDLSSYPVTRKVVEEGVPIQQHLTEPGLDPAEKAFMLQQDIQSMLMLPLIAQDQTIGMAELFCRTREHGFTQREINLAQTFSFYAASAIQNARLYQRTQEYTAELEERVQERTAELQAAKERTEGILASVPDAVFVLDEAGQLVHANQAGENLLAAARRQKTDLFAGITLIDLESGAVPSEKTILEVQERAYQPLASRLTISGQPGGHVLVLRDVTRFRELDRMKTQFVSDVSHELRTPLTNLTIYLDLLASTDDPEKREKHLETLTRETDRLTNLIEDLLTISRLEAGRVEVNSKPFQINQLVEDLAFDRSMMAESRRLGLKVRAGGKSSTCPG